MPHCHQAAEASKCRASASTGGSGPSSSNFAQLDMFSVWVQSVLPLNGGRGCIGSGMKSMACLDGSEMMKGSLQL